MINHFRTLGVSIDAEDVVIRAAWGAMLKRYHPDVDGSDGAADRTQAINEAYRVLRDPAARAQHRQALEEVIRQRRARAEQADRATFEATSPHSAAYSGAWDRIRPTSTAVHPKSDARAGTSATLVKWAGLILWAYILFRLFNALNGVGANQRPVEPAPDQEHAAQIETP